MRLVKREGRGRRAATGPGSPALGRVFFNHRFDHPPDPLPSQEGGREIISEGHPQTPAKGAKPLCTPHISAQCNHREEAESYLMDAPKLPAKRRSPLHTKYSICLFDNMSILYMLKLTCLE